MYFRVSCLLRCPFPFQGVLTYSECPAPDPHSALYGSPPTPPSTNSTLPLLPTPPSTKQVTTVPTYVIWPFSGLRPTQCAYAVTHMYIYMCALHKLVELFLFACIPLCKCFTFSRYVDNTQYITSTIPR